MENTAGGGSPPASSKLTDLDQLWNPVDPKASEAAYRELLRVAEQLSGQDQCYLIELHTQISRSESAQGRLKEALSSLKIAEQLLGEQEAAYRVSAKIRWLLERGRLYILEKTPSQAQPLFMQAWTLAVNSGEDFFAVDGALMLAAVEPRKEQQQWITRAIKLAENSPQQNTKRLLGSLYASLGWKLYDLRQYDTSLEIFQKALSHLKTHGTERELFIAKWSIGKLLRTMGRTEEALAIQNTLLAELRVGGGKDGRLFEELAECLYSLKRSSEAELYFELAFRELSNDEWVADNQPVKLRRLKDLGKVKK